MEKAKPSQGSSSSVRDLQGFSRLSMEIRLQIYCYAADEVCPTLITVSDMMEDEEAVSLLMKRKRTPEEEEMGNPRAAEYPFTFPMTLASSLIMTRDQTFSQLVHMYCDEENHSRSLFLIHSLIQSRPTSWFKDRASEVHPSHLERLLLHLLSHHSQRQRSCQIRTETLRDTEGGAGANKQNVDSEQVLVGLRLLDSYLSSSPVSAMMFWNIRDSFVIDNTVDMLQQLSPLPGALTEGAEASKGLFDENRKGSDLESIYKARIFESISSIVDAPRRVSLKMLVECFIRILTSARDRYGKESEEQKQRGDPSYAYRHILESCLRGITALAKNFESLRPDMLPLLHGFFLEWFECNEDQSRTLACVYANEETYILAWELLQHLLCNCVENKRFLLHQSTNDRLTPRCSDLLVCIKSGLRNEARRNVVSAICRVLLELISGYSEEGMVWGVWRVMSDELVTACERGNNLAAMIMTLCAQSWVGLSYASSIAPESEHDVLSLAGERSVQALLQRAEGLLYELSQTKEAAHRQSEENTENAAEKRIYLRNIENALCVIFGSSQTDDAEAFEVGYFDYSDFDFEPSSSLHRQALTVGIHW